MGMQLLHIQIKSTRN